MTCGRRLGLVAAVALVAACGEHATTVGTAAAPAPSATDAGASSGGGDAGAVTAACAQQPSLFAPGAIVATSDAAYVYLFSRDRLERIALGGGAPDVIVDGIKNGIDFDASVDDRYVYWRLHGSDGEVPALVRAPKTGGAAVVLGSGGGDPAHAPYVIADPIYFMHGGFFDAIAPDGSGQTEVLSADNILAANRHSVFYLDTSAGLRIRTLPTTSPPTAHSAGYVEADDRFVYILWTNELRRYAIADSSYSVIARFDGTLADTPSALRLAGDRVYIMVGFAGGAHHIDSVGIGGSHHVTVVRDVAETWTVAGDSIYFNRNGDVYRVCR